MINLIPDHVRANNKYAVRNVHLLRYVLISAATMAGIGVITGLGIVGMLSTQNNLQGQIDDQNQKLSSYKPLEAQGQNLSDQIGTISTLLNRQVTFSSLLPDIAKVMPNGAILRELDFSTSDILQSTNSATSSAPTGSSPSGNNTAAPTVVATQKPFVILAAVESRTVASTLLENIKSRKDLFTDADLVDVSQTSAASGSASTSSKYPYQVTINAYLKKLDPKTLNGGAK